MIEIWTNFDLVAVGGIKCQRHFTGDILQHIVIADAINFRHELFHIVNVVKGLLKDRFNLGFKASEKRNDILFGVLVVL